MPTYIYRCENCKQEFEKFILFSEGTKNIIKCEYCQTIKAEKKINNANIIFKGSGFYSTDKRKDKDSG